MNVAEIIGQVDVYSASVAIAFAAGATVTSSILLSRFQTRRNTDQQFELEKIKLSNAEASNVRAFEVDREVKLGQIASSRQIEIARIESGMLDVKSTRSNPDQ